MGNAIKAHIENAEKTGVCQLLDMGLKEWPPELRRLHKNLRTLDVSKNSLQTIPDDIGHFANLKQLVATSNKLGSLSRSIGNLKKLESLSLDDNKLTTLPPTVSSLSSLRTFSARGNHIREFPMALCGLKHLNSVDLSKNLITIVPSDVRKLDVVELNLNQNQISSLPSTLSECPRLKVLRVEENCLSADSLPPGLLKNSSIALFAVEGNVFSTKQFSELDGYDQYMERYTATKKKCM